MTEEQRNFLAQLINTPTPSGSESAGAILLGRRITAKTGIKSSIDMHGNLHAVFDAGAKTTVMLEGHIDEIGFIVEYIDDRGYVYFQPLGGVVAAATPAERVVILSEKGLVNGVIGNRPPHLAKAGMGEAEQRAGLHQMPCDIGATSRKEAESLVSIGDSAIVDSGFRVLAGARASGRGFDDRIGAFAMCEAFMRLATATEKPAVNLHYVASVSEELGLVGGRLASYSVHPAIGISCDVGHARGPAAEDVKIIGDVELGRGAALSTGPIYHKGLVAHFRRTAEQRGIPYQLRAVPKGAGNNGWALKMEHGGAAVVQIAVPLRYMHSPVEVLDLGDVDSVIDLVSGSVAGLSDDFPLLPEQP